MKIVKWNEGVNCMPPQHHKDSTKKDMGPTPKANPLVGIGGSVTAKVRGKIYAEAERIGITPARLIGQLVSEFAEGLPDWVDPNQGELDLAIEVPKLDN